MSSAQREESRRAGARPGPAGSLAEQVLAHAQSGREIVQDFAALADSLEWSLGQEYLRQRGNKAFLSDASPVPFVVNNDGTLSRNAAEVFFTSLQTTERDGTLEEEIIVLELGIGVGVFALPRVRCATLGYGIKPLRGRKGDMVTTNNVSITAPGCLRSTISWFPTGGST